MNTRASPVDIVDAALARLGARMRVLAWSSRASHAHHMKEMAVVRGEDEKAYAAWQAICDARRSYWAEVANG